jgi:hypothetical protein
MLSSTLLLNRRISGYYIYRRSNRSVEFVFRISYVHLLFFRKVLEEAIKNKPMFCISIDNKQVYKRMFVTSIHAEKDIHIDRIFVIVFWSRCVSL